MVCWKIEIGFKCRCAVLGCRRRIGNPVQIRNGTATVCVEAWINGESPPLGN